ncbi:MAG TPA: Rne/Rng family ribonuclease [Candidatus Eisenbacteria bacterium]|nr:Rne/Rng family ribonuclease [Candidatus Eisenbacteria bacterium]
MSKELVISATSHERRVAILEEGQLVEIYIEREKEFALVGSIYKGKVTRVLPGMQSAFVDIGLDGDAFLYVSDVFENLDDYDHGHGHDSGGGNGHPSAPQISGEVTAPIEVLPGESLSRSSAPSSFAATEPGQESADDIEAHDVRTHVEEAESGAPGVDEPQASEAGDDERQPESNESAPPNFAPQYNPTQYRPSPGYGPRSDRGPAERGGDRGGDRGGARGDRPQFGRGRGRFGRSRGRGGRGGRDFRQGSGRDLPPSKYASPQGGERGNDRGPDRGPDRTNDRGGDRGDRRNDRGGRGYSNRGGYENRGPRRDFDNRGSDAPRPSDPGEEPIVLPGESLAKYRGKPPIEAASPVAEPERFEPQPEPDEPQPRVSGQPAPAGTPRRSRGGLPSWLLAGPAADPSETVEGSPSREEEAFRESANADIDPEDDVSAVAEAAISDEEATVLSSSLIEAKQDLVREEADADSATGSGAIFEDEEADDEDEEETRAEQEQREQEEAEEAEHSEDSDDQAAVQEILSAPQAIAEAEADAAHENALHIAALGEHVIDDSQETEDELESTSGLEPETAAEEQDEIAASVAPAAHSEEDTFLLPGETRSPHSGAESQGEFPRQSARVGGNPRSRFQRPFRGGRDRNDRGDRGGRGGRPDRGGDRGRGRGRFERRGPGGGHRPHQGHGHHGHGHHGPRRPQLISEMLRAGQEIVVQIAKEPLGKKGARITSHIALPGRFLVYMPTIDHIGVSRKIASAENRSRLRRIVGEARGSYPGGFIVRTAAGAATDDEIRTDIEFLGKTWNEIKHKHDERKAPSILHHDLNLVERILRDYVSDDFTAIWIDNEEEYGKVCEFVSRFQPKLVNRVKLYSKEQPIFEEFGIQHELDKALRAKVWLKSGGYIVINHTEALVAIDVNTGKFVGKGSTRLEDTIVKTNLEAVKEIVRQIRLRDLGGIIVVDFIDMEERRNREKVLSALQQALDQDKAPSKALSFNEFGLVCITRKRTKQALERVLCQPCPSCTGSGMVKSIPTLCYEIQNEARKMAAADRDNPNLTLRVHPEIAKALKTRESMLIDELEQNSHKHIIIQSDATLHWEQYDIY